MANPFYHLRPNKSIDRSLFIQTLHGLNQLYSISKYQYTGFGSYMFDDFKLIHDALDICKMTSLEMNLIEYERAKYNVPYSCIDIKNMSSTSYIANLNLTDDSHNIFWLDYTSPKDLGKQISDYQTLINVLNACDIVRITVNANPYALVEGGDPDTLNLRQLDRLKERIPERLFPVDVTPDCMTMDRYPLLLLKIFEAASVEILKDDPPYSPNFIVPLFSTVYADGQHQMLTFTGLILDSHQQEERVKYALNNYAHITFAWDRPCKIKIPALTVREISELNKLLPDQNARSRMISEFPFIFQREDDFIVDSYILYYKYYPNYHHISL